MTRTTAVYSRIAALLSFVLLLPACEKERDTYYERPAWLQGPLYEQIKSAGEYNEFISLVEYIGYDKYLSSRLTFTLFLPTDEAFQSFYQEHGVSSYEEMDTTYLRDLVDYHLLANSWDSTRMIQKTSWWYWGGSVENFRTPSLYAPPIEVIDGRNVFYDHTFLHLFSSAFFNYYGLNATDYETFFPDSRYTGYNVGRAAIVEDQLGSENGFYYVIDKVLEPRSTADRVIAEEPDFSVFKSLLDIFGNYYYSSSLSRGHSDYDSLFFHSYFLNVDLADEKMTDSAPDGFYHVLNTIFVPVNQAIIDFFDQNFPAYGGLENVPNIIIKYFVEAHLIFNKKLFPTVLDREENETNDFSDPIEYTLSDGIISSEMSSNAIIYGVETPINTNAFSTVSGPIIKNPDYRIFTMMLELSGEMRTFFKREIGHVAFVLSDELMADSGFNYYEGNPVDFTDDRIFRDNDVMSAAQIKEFLKDYISITYKDVGSSDQTFIKTKKDQYMEVTNEKVSGVFGEAQIVNQYDAINGTVLEVDQPLEALHPYTIENYLNDNKDTYSEFYALCQEGGFTGGDQDTITKLSVFNGVTVLLPTNEAVQEIMGNYLPPGAGKDEIRSLVQYQIISERAIFTDDDFTSAPYGTDLFLNGERMKITTQASGGLVTTIDLKGNSNSFGPGPGRNIITSNGVIQVVDKMFLY